MATEAVIWFAFSFLSLPFLMLVVYNSLEDLRVYKETGIHDGRQLVAEGALTFALVLLVLCVLFILVGIAAVVFRSSFWFRTGLMTMSIVFFVASFIHWYRRWRIDRYMKRVRKVGGIFNGRQRH